MACRRRYEVCGDPTTEPHATRPVQDWQIVSPRCPECETRAGHASAAQVMSEGEET